MAHAPALALALEGAARPSAKPRPMTPAARDALLDALRSERKLLDELVATLRRQRSAVGTDDLQAVDDSVFATHRILATLGQARVRRRQINRLIVGVEELPARDLETVLGEGMDDVLRGARDELQASAAVLAREVDVNRRVLRDALSSGDAQARALAGIPAAAPNGVVGANVGGNAGALLDRTG
ncbi:flagellar export chaperone FlgN [Gemmatirosa kalamazoonensis]|nr:flagellar export chaperone FlgN [Gemmatirosa kalamazoonensis]